LLLLIRKEKKESVNIVFQANPSFTISEATVVLDIKCDCTTKRLRLSGRQSALFLKNGLFVPGVDLLQNVFTFVMKKAENC